MIETVISTGGLCKSYKDSFVLDHVNMEVKRGDIYGFVGENGAGKTTLIRLLTGLSFPTSGDISLFGEQLNLEKHRKRIGAIVENPMLYPNLTARQNLEVERIQRGIPGKRCIDEVLELVNLKDTGNKKTKHFSLGMKQRLGIAGALLTSPELLILDEPTNGLDPIGIVELRELLLKLSHERNIVVLISSHILGELYQLANCYGFIHQGKMLEQMTAKELDEKNKKHISLKVDDTAKAVAVIENALKVSKYEVYPDNEIKIYGHFDQIGTINRRLIMNDVTIFESTIRGDNLENYYRRLIGGQQNV
ncbi:MAG: ATP-binding cassette domain-containing protein [Lachnospiraceae bacterium]